MKWLNLIILFLIFTTIVKSQNEWFPEGSEAFYSYSGFDPNVFYARTFALKDTLINNKQAKILITNFTFFDHPDQERLYEKIIIHQDGNKIYRWIQDKFRLLYDFDLNVGDTLKIFVPGNLYGSETDTLAYFRIDSISALALNGKQLKSQYIRVIDKGASSFAAQFSGWAYETFGSESYFLPVNQIECDHWCIWPLRCFTDGEDEFNRFSIPCDTIVLITSKNENIIENSLTLYPNPISPGTAINFIGKNIEPQHITIHDVSGKLITAYDYGIDTVISPIKAGIYFLRYKIRDKFIVEKLVVID